MRPTSAGCSRYRTSVARSDGLLADFSVFLLSEHQDVAAAAMLLARRGVHRLPDGYVARRFHQVSNVGKMLDPMVDVSCSCPRSSRRGLHGVP